MSPTILFKDDEPIAAYGSPGGSTIINSVLNTTLNLIDHEMTIPAGDRRAAPLGHERSRCHILRGGQSFMTPAFPADDAECAHIMLQPVPLVGGVPTCNSTIGSVQGWSSICRPASSTVAPINAAKAR